MRHLNNFKLCPVLQTVFWIAMEIQEPGCWDWDRKWFYSGNTSVNYTYNSAKKCLHFYDSRIITDAKLRVYLKSKCISFHFSPCLFFNQITAIFIEWIEWYHFEFFIEEIFFHTCHKLAFYVRLLKHFFIHNNFVLVIEVFSSH